MEILANHRGMPSLPSAACIPSFLLNSSHAQSALPSIEATTFTGETATDKRLGGQTWLLTESLLKEALNAPASRENAHVFALNPQEQVIARVNGTPDRATLDVTESTLSGIRSCSTSLRSLGL